MKKENNNTLLIVIVVILSLFLFSGFGYGMMGYEGMWGMMSGNYGYETGNSIFGWIFSLIILVVLVLLIVWLVKQINKS